MKRIYHHFKDCEDTKTNMWKKPKNKELMLVQTIEFMKNTDLFEKAMLRVITEWKNSCEHFLTNISFNRIAWLGQAACALEKDFCQDIVKEAWSYLTEEEQNNANERADNAIKKWEKCQKNI